MAALEILFTVLPWVVGAPVFLIIIYLAIIVFAPGFEVPGQAVVSGGTSIAASTAGEAIDFSVGEENLRGHLYPPVDAKAPVPLVVLNHGFGGFRDLLLESYALRFNRAGIAALTYDYRYFGASDGEPRQLS